MDPVKGIAAGLIGGLAGAFAMSRFQQRWTKAVDVPSYGDAQLHGDAQRHGNDALSHPVVHYGFGAAMGAMYGYYVETTEHRGLKSGAKFGMSVWAAADEVARPALGLTGSEVARPAGVHAESFASHVVFGVTTEVVRRGVRAILR